MIGPALASEALLRRLNGVLIGVGGLVTVTVLGLGLGILFAGKSVREARDDRAAANERTRLADVTLTSARGLVRRKIPTRVDQQVELFASGLAKACREEEVDFLSCDSSGDAQAFTSRYGGAGTATNWKATETRVTIRGRLADIYTVLGKLKGRAIPFEVVAGSLDSEQTTGGVRSAMTIAAIVREEKAPVAGQGERVADRR